MRIILAAKGSALQTLASNPGKTSTIDGPPVSSKRWAANIQVIANRDNAVLIPGRPQFKDPTDWAFISALAFSRLGNRAAWIAPSFAFNSFVPSSGDWIIVSPQPRENNERLIGWLDHNQHVNIVLAAGGGLLDLLPQILWKNLVKGVLLTGDKIVAATGLYDRRRALSSLAGYNYSTLIVATNPETAMATINRAYFQQPAFSLRSPAIGQGKGPAFLASFLTVFNEAGDVDRALRAGHANAAAVATSWQADGALLDWKALQIILS